MPPPHVLVPLVLAALAAGFIDAVVGGGGLITIPALMLGLPPGTPVPTILGTNKVVACTGTTAAAVQFARSRILSWRDMVPPILCAMAGAAAGVALAYAFQKRLEPFFRPVMLCLLVAMLLFTLLRPGLGRHHAPRHEASRERLLTGVISAALGFYDGFFGPGTGSILIFLFVTVLGFDFLRSSALAKSVNWASNFASLVLFVSRGSWVPAVGLAMAVGNGLGGWLGARTALSRGSGLVRALFILVVSVLILSLAWKTFHP